MENRSFTLITGASEGLGKAFAIECAKRNMNLVLIALPATGLEELADFLVRNFGIRVIVFGTDLTDTNCCFELFRRMQERGIQLNLLINNAGLGSTVLFDQGAIGMFERQIKLNVLATTILTRLFLDNLRMHTPSYILNVGSMAGFFHLPKKQVYGGTKSYILSFSRSLRRELKKDNIRVSVLCPGGMNTNISVTLLNQSGTWFSRMSILNPEQVAPIAIDGLLAGKEIIVPGRLNRLLLLLDKVLPGFVKSWITAYNMNRMNPVNRYWSPPERRDPLSQDRVDAA